MVKLKLFCTLIVSALLLLACGSKNNPSPTVEQEAVETEAIVAVQPETDECVACHTDKQRLIDTAKPEVETEAESKGVG